MYVTVGRQTYFIIPILKENIAQMEHRVMLDHFSAFLVGFSTITGGNGL